MCIRDSFHSHRADVKSGVSALSSTSTSFGSAAQQAEGVEESLRQQALAEEEAAINHYKVLYMLWNRKVILIVIKIYFI